MEHLSKQQLILLALLVSFVTSLSTGIVTVSLMDQAPQGVTRTVSQVIERTIQAAVPQDASVGTATGSGDLTARAVSQVSASVVQLESSHSAGVTGLGLVVSKSGVIVADKTSIAGLGDYVAIMPDGAHISVAVVQMQANGDIVFLAPSSATSTAAFVPIAFGGLPKLGASALSLSGTSTQVLGQGLVTEIVPADLHSDGIDQGHISTTISSHSVMLGSPLFGADGSVVGMLTDSLSKKETADFYPISQLKAVIPVLK
jgi:hypothetical protein